MSGARRGEAAAAGVPAVVALVGASDALRDEAVRALRAEVVGGGDDFNSDAFDASEEGVQRALQALATLPMLAARRWVHLANLQRLTGGVAARLVAYLERPQAHAVLCLSAGRLDMRTQLGRAVQRHADLRHVGPPSAGALPGWLVAWGQRHRAPMTHEAAAMLVALRGAEPGALCRAAEAVALFAHPAQPFTGEHVAASQAAIAPAQIFALGEAVGQRRWSAASALLHALLAEGQPAVLILNLLARHLQQLLVARSLPAAERRGGGLAARLGVPPGVADRLVRQAASWAPEALVAALQRALAADVALKSTGGIPAVVLEAALWDIAAPAAPPADSARP